MDLDGRPYDYHLVNGRCDAKTFASFGEIYLLASATRPPVFTINCAHLAFCNGNLSAALSVVHNQLSGFGTGLRLDQMQPGVRSILNDAGLFGSGYQRPRPSVIPLTPFRAGESTRFDLYARKGLETRGLPTMSRQLADRFFLGIHELFTNFEIHSQSGRGAMACGQLYPQLGRVEMTLVDHGVGIPSEIMKRGYASTPQAAIAWAMSGTNTTRAGDVPGGLGLKILREFITLNGGELTIASQGGFWKETAGRVDMRPLPHPFPGTAVTIVVNTKDTQSYRLTNEVKPGDIF